MIKWLNGLTVSRGKPGSLGRKASAMPGVIVHRDDDGVEVKRFHSETSGHTMLYAGNGRLMFHGGITFSRGHSGDNSGRSALVALLENEGSNQSKTPVFGCSLFEDDCPAEVSKCKK